MVRRCMPGQLAGSRVDQGQEVSLADQCRCMSWLREVHPRLQLRGDWDEEAHCPKRKGTRRCLCLARLGESGATTASVWLGCGNLAFDLLNILLGQFGHLLGALAGLSNSLVASFDG